jgi:hypothetical protein
LEDPRVRSSDGLWAIIKQVDGDSADLRRLAARRYLAATDKKEARHWINALDGLPVGAYADPLPEEREILTDPAVSCFATGLIKRQGDRGVDAVPDLLRLLREYSVYDPGKYGFSDLTAATDAVRSGFRRIGPAASFARPEIEQLLASPGLEYRYKTLGQEEWDTLLVVLGKPVENRVIGPYSARCSRMRARSIDSVEPGRPMVTERAGSCRVSPLIAAWRRTASSTTAGSKSRSAPARRRMWMSKRMQVAPVASGQRSAVRVQWSTGIEL